MAVKGSSETALTYDIDQDMVDNWAELSGDFNPLHVDPLFAAASRFGRTIAHGHLSVALLFQALEKRRGGHLDGDVVVRGIQFRAPVYVGASYRAIVDLNPIGPGLQLSIVDGTGQVCVEATSQMSCAARACRTRGAGRPAAAQTQPARELKRERPLLWADDLTTARTFQPVTVTCSRERAERYLQIVGASLERRDCFPAGLAPVVGRWSYLAEYTMPPGGVLLGMDVRVKTVPLIDERIVATASIARVTNRPNSRDVSIVSKALSAGGVSQRVRFNIRWPSRTEG